MGRSTKIISTTSILALVMSLSAASVLTLSATAAHAERGGNGKSNSSRGRDRNSDARSNNGRGAVARELRGMNAAHANQNALENASQNSQVGKLYIYQQAEIVSAAAADELEAAQAEYDRLIGLTEEQIEEEFPDGGYEDAVTQAAIDLEDAETTAETAADSANDALLVASGGRTISDAARDELNDLLGL